MFDSVFFFFLFSPKCCQNFFLKAWMGFGIIQVLNATAIKTCFY